MGSARGTIALPVEIYSPQGHKLNLSYKQFNAEYMMLGAIRDGRGELLLEVEREDGFIEIRERPYLGGDGKPVALYVMTLQDVDNRVASFSLPTAEQASWRFDYKVVLEHLCITEVRTPTGAREYLQYNDGGHLFPSGERKPLPRVTRHIVEPGLQQPAFQTNYSYPQNSNFLGFGTRVGWSDDGLDNLYKHTGDYEYQTVQELCDSDNARLQCITRTFNRFHLPTLVRTERGTSVHEVITRYEITDNVPFAQQVSTCQLPIKQQTRWSMDGHTPSNRLETAETKYDSFGNPIERTQPNGVVERMTWYGSEAEEGYPGDPYGFVRHMKSKTVIPSTAGEASAPTLVRQYRYRALPTLAGNDTKLRHWPVEHSETLLHEGQVLEQTISSHVDAPRSGLLHGRLYQQIHKLGTLETTTQYQFRVMADPISEQPVLQTTTTIHGYDGTLRSSLMQRSLLLGETVFEEDESGVQTHREHDALRRVTRERVAPGTSFEASRRYVYELCAADGDIARQHATNARGVTTRTEVDGLGRVTFEARDNIHEQRPTLFFETLATRYDAQGQRDSETRTDWLQGERYLTLVNRYQYDGWGELRCTIDPDGVEHHDELDPIGVPGHDGPVRRSWREGGTLQARVTSGKSETWLNLFEKPAKVKRLTPLGELLGEVSYLYDGLGRTVSETNERRHTTTFAYDPWGRMLSTRLADDTLLTRTYAAHSTEELPASVTVTPANTELPAQEVGAQYHDGLDRLMGATTGGRTEYFHFEAGAPHPLRRVTPAGDTIKLTYTPALNDEPISSIAPDDPANFDYHPTSARLLSTCNPQGTRRFDYNLANQLTAEHWDDAGNQTFSRTHVSTVFDRLKSTHEDAGVYTVHDYDTHGRLETTEQGQLKARIHYDALGRVSKLDSTDLASGTLLEALIEYDDQDRECRKTWRQDGQAERILEQRWGEDDLLQWRKLTQGGATLLEETFEYDLRGRLTKHVCEGPERPVDALGRRLATQTIGFDAYDSISLTVTSFEGGPRPERAKYVYADQDPCQLVRIEYTPKRSEPDPTFTYDANGNLTRDEQGRVLRYDSQNRLTGIEGSAISYRYDADGQLVASTSANGPQTLFLRDGLQLRQAVHDGVKTLYLHHGDQPLGQQQSGSGAQVPLLLHTGTCYNVIAETQAGSLRTRHYTAYGEGYSEQPLHSALGYTGEALDAGTGWYLLGNGYRAFNPVLMRFHSPDALSPFAEGGLNCYGYCQGNPVTFRDPTGHYSSGYSGTSRSLEDIETNRVSPRVELGVMGWIGMGFGFLFAAIASVAAVVITGGVAAPAVAAAWTAAGGGLAGTGAAVAAGAGAIASVSIATGIKLAGSIVGAALSVAGTAVQTEGVLSGNEERSNIGAILNYAAVVAGLGAGALGYVAGSASKMLSRATYSVLENAMNPIGPRIRPPVPPKPTSAPTAGNSLWRPSWLYSGQVRKNIPKFRQDIRR
ncbi:RHS repeat-associated core domain-containing protein [Pseudomonas sp. SAR267]|uniref:RHS repeat-associated core domain-containing protein n=1 Tax=unclassified Pseudomonas TaxID=196821 RepID=UPI0028A779D8|nr:RHS repeat-associated core domain-containing protein [Pseudomonas sp.]